MELYNIVSFVGIFVLLALAWGTSGKWIRPNLRIVVGGVGLQLLFALFIFQVPAGKQLFTWLNDFAVAVLGHASKGAEFLFGPLALSPGTKGSLGFILAFQALPTIIFFSALISILYYTGIMQRIVELFSKLFSKLLGVSGAESLCAASNIFVGVESAFTIKPYIHKLTPSEMTTVLTTGMATVASNVLALYVFTLHAQFETIAGHLISASFLSAPAALIMSKLIMPETETPETAGVNVVVSYEKENSLFESIMNGASAGVKVIVGIGSLLVAVIGLVSLSDAFLGWMGNLVNGDWGLEGTWSISAILGWIFYPLTLIIGIPLEDAGHVSRLIGDRVIFTEVFSYQKLAELLKNGTLIHGRSSVIAAYALCGFAHVASMAIFAGGFASVADNQKPVIAKVVFRALWASTLACLLTAAIAGTFYSGTGILK